MSRHANPPTAARILVVADWKVDPEAVVAALWRRAAEAGAVFTLLVPARLHGLDWVGDPTASVPCARRQIDRLAELCTRAGLAVEVAGVGDPDVLSAIGDALEERVATEIVLFERRGRLGLHPLHLVHRAQRATGRPAHRIEVPPSAGPRGRHGWTLPCAGGHCEAEGLQAA